MESLFQPQLWTVTEAVSNDALVAKLCGIEVLRRLVETYGLHTVDPAGWLDFDMIRSRIGFSVEIWGSHHAAGSANTHCHECQCLNWLLRAVASYLLPDKAAECKKDPSSVHEVRVFRGLDEAHVQGIAVVLTHSTELFAADDCDVTCTDQVRFRLQELGIRELRSGQDSIA